MKKNISINISGIIFHIEEDGYEQLQRYLDSINNYFSSYEESEEIIADIESRIAEIFLEKLSEGKQVVSAEDVAELMATMGNTTDFEAIEEETDFAQDTSAQSKEEDTKKESTSSSYQSGSQQSYGNAQQRSRSKTLKRDLNNQILGGVCSGLAHYMRIDAIWIRILFLLFLPTGFSLLAYFILWVAVPGSDDLIEHTSVKKFYRDPNDRVLGGVCSGLAKYLNIDIIIVRIIFILLLIGGVGLIAYLVLWVITPEASSITDRMQMKGEEVTLSNIDENIKKERVEEDFGPKGEGAFTKVLLFPFRLVGKILSGISRALAPLMLFIVAVVRIFTGGIISIVGLSMMFSVLFVAGIVLGLYNGEWYTLNGDFADIPYEVLDNTIPYAGLIALGIVIFIPFLFVFIAGITIIAKRKIMSSPFGWSTLGIWLIALLVTAATVPNVVTDFRDESSITQTETLNTRGETLVLDIDERYNYRRSNDFFLIDLDLRASKDDQLRLDQRIRARGRNRSLAEENASRVEYNYTVQDSVITFDDMFTLRPNSKYRAQELELTLYIPEGQPFQVKRGMEELMGRFGRGFRWSTAYRNTWVFTEKGLECLTCESRRNDRSSTTTDISGDFRRVIDLDNIHQVNLRDAFKVTIEKSDDEQVIIESSNRRVRDVFAQSTYDELEISGPGMSDRQTRDINVTIYISDLDKVIARDKVDLELRGFENNDILDVTVRNEARVEIEGNYSKVDAEIVNEGRLILLGSTDELEATLYDDSRLTATDSEIVRASLDTHSDAFVRLKVADYLRVDAKGRSTVRYEGNPELDLVNNSRSATVEAY